MSITRRKVLISGLCLGGAAALGFGCSDSGTPGDGSAGSDASSAGDWIISGASFIEGSGGTFDLKPTLPAGTPAGGTFGVDAAGVTLPTGMSLSPDGILSVGTATAHIIEGVVFTYEVG